MIDDQGNRYFGCIYIVENIQNNKVYIGQTTYEYEKYIQNHFESALKNIDKRYKKYKGKYLYSAIRKYGKQNFKYRIIGFCNSKEELDEAERECIYFYRAYGFDGENFDNIYGYNMTPGGGGACGNSNHGHTRKGKTYEEIYGEEKAKEIKNKVKKSNLGKKKKTRGLPAWNRGIPRTIEEKKKMSESKLGKPNYKLRGKKQSEDHKKNLSDSRKEKFKKGKIVVWNKGIPRTIEEKEKMSKAKLGKPNYKLRGRKVSEKTKRKMKENHYDSSSENNSNAKMYLVITPDGEKIFLHGKFCSFCKLHHIDAGSLKKVADNKIDNYKGWRCIRIKNDNI